MKEGMRTSLTTWLKIFLAWTVAGLFYVTQNFMTRLAWNESIAWREIVGGWMSAVYICALFTPAMLWFGNRWQVEGPHRAANIAVHSALSIIFSNVFIALNVPVLLALGVLHTVGAQALSLGRGFRTLFPLDFHGGIVRYWAVIALQALYRSLREARRRERETLELQVRSSELTSQLASAQLNALKMQLHPHFLFNTLSAIMVLVRQQKSREAETMLSRLSDLLRGTLDDVDAQEVPLWREFEFLRLYLSIEQVRFEDRLRVRMDSAPELSDALVPHMALQPLVENAIRHGLGRSEQPVLIQISSRRTNGNLTLTVTDDGPGSPDSGFEGNGIGLANTRSRLERLYGPRARLIAENRVPNGVEVTMTLPYHTGRLEDGECG